MRFNFEEVRASMPGDTLFITSVREPGALFQSTFYYFWSSVTAFRKVPHYGKDALEQWLDNAALFTRDLIQRRSTRQFTKNPTMFDLGFDNEVDEESYIQDAIKKLDEIFDLVIVADYFYESVVLLADLLCWDLNDVVCFTVNARTNNTRIYKDQQERIRNKARKWNKADASLFDHFNASLWRRVNLYGRSRMAKDIKRLQNLTNSLLVDCVEENHSVELSLVRDPEFKKVVYQPEDVSVQSYNLKVDSKNLKQCQELIEGENNFGKKIYDHHVAKYRGTWKWWGLV